MKLCCFMREFTAITAAWQWVAGVDTEARGGKRWPPERCVCRAEGRNSWESGPTLSRCCYRRSRDGFDFHILSHPPNSASQQSSQHMGSHVNVCYVIIEWKVTLLLIPPRPPNASCAALVSSCSVGFPNPLDIPMQYLMSGSTTKRGCIFICCKKINK